MGGKRKHQIAEQKIHSQSKGNAKSYTKMQRDSGDGDFRFSESLENRSVSYVIAVLVIGECLMSMTMCSSVPGHG